MRRAGAGQSTLNAFVVAPDSFGFIRLPEHCSSVYRPSAHAAMNESGCDFKVINDDGEKPFACHLYCMKTLTTPALKTLVVGNTPSEAATDLLAETARLRTGIYEESGLQTRCLAVWLHGERLKAGASQRLDALGYPPVLVTPRAHRCIEPQLI